MRSAEEEARSTFMAEDAVEVSDDPIQFCVDWLGYTPFEYKWPFLEDNSANVPLLNTLAKAKSFLNF